MGGVTILHCADLHFGKPFPELAPDQAEIRQREVWGVFENILAMVTAEKVQFLLISGDLFEQETAGSQLVADISRRLGELKPVKVFIVPGEHDPYVVNSSYRLVVWPENVHIFGGRRSAVRLPELGVAVYGEGLTSFSERQDLLRGFRAEHEEMIKMMLLHGNVRTDEIEISGLDYLALGHHHAYGGVRKSGGTAWAYPGSPVHRGFSGEKGGVLVGEVGRGSAQLDFRTVDRRLYLVETVNLQRLNRDDEIVDTIHKMVGPEQRRQNCYRFILQGEWLAPVNTAVLQQKLTQDFFYVEVVDNLDSNSSAGGNAGDFNLRGIFTRRVQERILAATDHDNREQWELALKIGLSALEQGRVIK